MTFGQLSGVTSEFRLHPGCLYQNPGLFKTLDPRLKGHPGDCCFQQLFLYSRTKHGFVCLSRQYKSRAKLPRSFSERITLSCLTRCVQCQRKSTSRLSMAFHCTVHGSRLIQSGFYFQRIPSRHAVLFWNFAGLFALWTQKHFSSFV